MEADLSEQEKLQKYIEELQGKLAHLGEQKTHAEVMAQISGSFGRTAIKYLEVIDTDLSKDWTKLNQSMNKMLIKMALKSLEVIKEF